MAHASGKMTQLALPTLSVDSIYEEPLDQGRRPYRLRINCTSSRVAIITEEGLLKMFELRNKSKTIERGMGSTQESVGVLIADHIFLHSTLITFCMLEYWNTSWIWKKRCLGHALVRQMHIPLQSTLLSICFIGRTRTQSFLLFRKNQELTSSEDWTQKNL